jgi:ribonuclease VapC
VSKVVLDASALLALLNQEPGSEAVAEALPGAAISAVNLSEVVAKLVEAKMPGAAVRAILQPLDLDVQPFDAEMAYAAGALRAATRKLGLSLGDRACLALGKLMIRPVLTTDRAWAGLDLGVTVNAIR